jgi:hypothetical protein
VYLVSAVSLAMLAGGIVALVRQVFAFVVLDALPSEVLRQNTARAAGVTIVALPVWVVHWSLATRFARRDETERASPLRRLYLYAVLAAAVVVVAIGVSDLAGAFAALVARKPSGTALDLLDPLPLIAVALAVWWYHWQIAGRSRAVDGESGVSATIRRWAVYGTSYWALLVLLAAATALLRFFFELLAGPPTAGADLTVTEAVGPALAGLLVWSFHWTWSSRAPVADEDRRSVLRSVYLLGALAVAVTVTLVQAGQVLFYILGRLLGVETPGGQTGTILQLLVGPAAAGTVYGSAWWYHLRVLHRESAALTEEDPRRFGLRRLARYLVATVALSVLAVGLAGIVWTVGDLLTSSTASWDWREQMSFFATLAIVGLPTWLVVWRPRPDPAEAGALSRRLYVYLALSGAVLSVLIAGATMAYQVLALLIGARPSSEAVVDLVRAGAVVLVGVGVAGYHGRALQLDARSAGAAPRSRPTPARLRLIGPDGRVVRELAGELGALEAALDRVATEVPITEESRPR